MKNFLWVGLLFLLVGCACHDYENLPYYLYSVTQNSDINYDMISKIDSLPPGKVKLKNEFYPVKGDYTILRFLSFSYGPETDSKFESNNLLVLKINDKKEIIDGYFYPLQWAEPPFSKILCRINNRRIKLKRFMKIQSLIDKDNYFNYERGYLVLPKDFSPFGYNSIDEKKQEIYPYEPKEFEVPFEESIYLINE